MRKSNYRYIKFKFKYLCTSEQYFGWSNEINRNICGKLYNALRILSVVTDKSHFSKKISPKILNSLCTAFQIRDWGKIDAITLIQDLGVSLHSCCVYALYGSVSNFMLEESFCCNILMNCVINSNKKPRLLLPHLWIKEWNVM